MGIAIILFRKIPLLIQLPKTEMASNHLFLRLKNKIQFWQLMKNIPLESFLQKLLSKVRIITLKLERKTALWLESLRKRSLKQKNLSNDNYWNKVKEPTDINKKNNTHLPG